LLTITQQIRVGAVSGTLFAMAQGSHSQHLEGHADVGIRTGFRTGMASALKLPGVRARRVMRATRYADSFCALVGLEISRAND